MDGEVKSLGRGRKKSWELMEQDGILFELKMPSSKQYLALPLSPPGIFDSEKWLKCFEQGSVVQVL